MSKSNERKVTRRQVIKGLVALPALILVRCNPTPSSGETPGLADGYNWNDYEWGYAIDTSKCIGCNSCMRACRAENKVPDGVLRTWVERYLVDEDGEVHVDTAAEGDYVFGKPAEEVEAEKAYFVPKICNQCAKSVCNQVCPVGASYKTEDGIVLVDEKTCIGCGYCVQACPYGTRFINPETHISDKCTLCYHRITRGKETACVQACPTGARIFGNLKDPKSKLSMILKQRRYRVLLPEMGTHPRCYYLELDTEVI
jgi:tetrathionate reductase subunit B